VEANEVGRRIFWRHRWLLIICLIVPLVIVIPLRLSQPVTYAATSNIQAQATPPQVDTEVSAILSHVSAVATSPVVVRSAVASSGVHRNAVDVARHEVSATTLSSSAIIALTVTDPDRAVAVSLSHALANAVVNNLNGVSGPLGALTRQWAQLTATRNQVLRQLAAAQAAGEPATSTGVQTLLSELSSVQAQMSGNLSTEQQILSTSGASQGADVISTPVSATAVSRHVAAYAALAALLGLVVGLLIASIRELARPTIAEPGNGARELGLVLLGHARQDDGQVTGLDGELPARLNLAADHVGARTLVLTGPLPPAQLTDLAARLRGAHGPGNPANGEAAAGRVPWSRSPAHPLPGDLPRPEAGDAATADGSAATVGTISGPAPDAGAPRPAPTVVALPDITLACRPDHPALVLVLPEFARRAALDRVEDLRNTTGWPIIGVIGVRRHHTRPGLAELVNSARDRFGRQA
jgi:capsular polysaccharide biosynthesis protein